MDAPGGDPEELRGALRFLARLNRWTGSRRLLAGAVRGPRVLDVATGGADVPAYLVASGRVRFAVGLDRNPVILRLARASAPAVVFVRAEAARLPFADRCFDSVVCHLFFHHLDEPAAAAALGEMARVGRRVVVVDLARGFRLRVLVRLLTRLFTRNRLSRHDGPASADRAYTPEEALAVARRAGLDARVERRPFDRWVLTAGDRGDVASE